MIDDPSLPNVLLQDPLFQGTLPHRLLTERHLGFIDIGARGGIHDLVMPLAAVTAVLGFEPDETECAKMRQQLTEKALWGQWELEAVALSNKEGEATLYHMNQATNNSLLPPNMAFVERYRMESLWPAGTTPLQTTTLDQVLFGKKRQEVFWGELMKIDVQGAEYEVLQGARRTLTERTMALLIEVEFFPVYQGQKLFSDIELFLRGQGFSFYGFTSLHYRSCKGVDKRTGIGRERLYWADAVFFKDPLAAGFEQKTLPERSNVILFVSAILFGYLDFALELALSTWAKGREAEKIRQLIDGQAKRMASNPSRDVLKLAEHIRDNPGHANIEIGRYVDSRWHLGNYEDTGSAFSHERDKEL